MRGTARAAQDTTWMDRDNESMRFLGGSATPRVQAAPNLQLKRLRERLNEPVFAHRPIRPRRVIAYVRTLRGADSAPAFEVLAQEAAKRGWYVGHQFHDDTGPMAPQQSPRWVQARKLMHEGFADGVLVLDRSHISRDDSEYEIELTFVAECQCFTALVVPETAT